MSIKTKGALKTNLYQTAPKERVKDVIQQSEDEVKQLEWKGNNKGTNFKDSFSLTTRLELRTGS